MTDAQFVAAVRAALDQSPDPVRGLITRLELLIDATREVLSSRDQFLATARRRWKELCDLAGLPGGFPNETMRELKRLAVAHCRARGLTDRSNDDRLHNAAAYAVGLGMITDCYPGPKPETPIHPDRRKAACDELTAAMGALEDARDVLAELEAVKHGERNDPPPFVDESGNDQKVTGKNGRGPKPKYDPKDDQRIYDAMKTRSYRDYLALAQERGKRETPNDIERAIDRHRKRVKRK